MLNEYFSSICSNTNFPLSNSATADESAVAVDNAASKNMDEEIKEEEKTTSGRGAKQKQEEKHCLMFIKAKT